MTDSPELVATADLTPESPKPINLSSPATVPTLQDQADSLSTMALSPSEDMPISGITGLAQIFGDSGDSHSQADATAIAATAEASPSEPRSSSAGDAEMNNSSGEHDLSAEVEDEDEDDYAKDFDSPIPNADDSMQDGEASGDSNAATGDVLKTEPSPSDPSHTNTVVFAPQPTSTSVSGSDTQAATDVSRSAATANVTRDVADVNSTVESTIAPQSDDQDVVDIQALVDNITARHTASESVDNVAPEANENAAGTSPVANAQSSLPPKPPASEQPTAAGLHPEELHRFQPSVPPSVPNLIPAASLPYSYSPVVAPDSYAPSQVYPNAGTPMPLTNPYGAASAPGASAHNPNQSQRYDDFLKEERKYVSEAKWDRFPEGSRLFIGNLSSERVSKKEVFDIFSLYGRLAQISLKQAYGFVQYHAVTEGQAATEALQGTEISGRKIHLEYSRAQKKGGDGDNEKRGSRGGRGGHNQAERGDRNRFDNRRGGEGYRPRSPSPQRTSHSRQGSHGHGIRGQWDPPSDLPRRGRSRSPMSGGGGGGGYRRRSPSPYRRGPPVTEADLEIPRRYGPDVPDVQLLLLQDVNRDFVGWIQGAFVERGLKVDVMFLNPRFPRDLVIQRQVVEGVHGVIELDFRSQSVAKVPLQTFDRSAGRHNARFDQYQDLEPKIAAEVVARAKSQNQVQSSVYGNGQYPQINYPPQTHLPPQPYPGAHNQAPTNLNLGGLDNATLQRVLSAVQGGPQGGIPGHLHMGGAPGVDVNAVLSAMGANGGVAITSQRQPVVYSPAPTPGNPGDQAHVQNIMAQLSRYRQ